jgi:hypothetical protein
MHLNNLSYTSTSLLSMFGRYSKYGELELYFVSSRMSRFFGRFFAFDEICIDSFPLSGLIDLRFTGLFKSTYSSSSIPSYRIYSADPL